MTRLIELRRSYSMAEAYKAAMGMVAFDRYAVESAVDEWYRLVRSPRPPGDYPVVVRVARPSLGLVQLTVTGFVVEDVDRC